MKPGTNSTTWQSVWKHGKTRTIRVPIVLADQVLDYAKTIDAYPYYITPAVPSGFFSHQQIVLAALQKYIELKRQNYHPNQHSRSLDVNTRAWDELRKFRLLIHDRPELLL